MHDTGPSLYEVLFQNFSGELELHQVDEADQLVLSVLDNLQRVLNSRAGALAHLPGYGLPDMGMVLQGLAGAAHGLTGAMTATLLAYEPRLAQLEIELAPQSCPGHLEYVLHACLKAGDKVTFGTTLGAEGRILLRHLKRQDYLQSP